MPEKTHQTLPRSGQESDGEAEIPNKLYFKIGEVCDLTRVAAHVLRFWESEFSQIKPRRTDAGQRLYRQADVEQILRIKHLLYDKKFTISGARYHLNSNRRNLQLSKNSLSLAEISSELMAIRDMLD